MTDCTVWSDVNEEPFDTEWNTRECNELPVGVGDGEDPEIPDIYGPGIWNLVSNEDWETSESEDWETIEVEPQ